VSGERVVGGKDPMGLLAQAEDEGRAPAGSLGRAATMSATKDPMASLEAVLRVNERGGAGGGGGKG